MKKQLKNENGLTLAEMLAVIVISSIMMLLIVGIVIYVQKLYQSQSTESIDVMNLSYIAKVITKEVRVTNNIQIEENKIIFHKNDETNVFVFNEMSQAIERNGVPLVTNIATFTVDENREVPLSKKIIIEISSLSGKSIKTVLTVREGDTIERSVESK